MIGGAWPPAHLPLYPPLTATVKRKATLLCFVDNNIASEILSRYFNRQILVFQTDSNEFKLSRLRQVAWRVTEARFRRFPLPELIQVRYRKSPRDTGRTVQP